MSFEEVRGPIVVSLCWRMAMVGSTATKAKNALTS